MIQGASIKFFAEVVSGNWQYDYSRKLEDYEILGIPEYWIADYAGLGGTRHIGRPKRPVFVKGKNYTGHSPRLLKHPEFRKFVEGQLSQELEEVPKALIVPQGKAVAEVLRHLSVEGKVSEQRCLLDFPHASGANGHRRRLFEQSLESMRQQVQDWFVAPERLE